MRRIDRDMRSRSKITGRYIRDRRYEPRMEMSDRMDRRGERMNRMDRQDMRSRRREDYRYMDDDRYYDEYNDYDFRGRKDYGEDCYLSEDELMDWAKDLLSEVPESDKQLFTKDMVERKAQEMGITFKEFTFPEFYTTLLMLYTDFRKTLGSGNLDVYARMSKDFLEDEDIDIDGGEKLCKYYDHIVCAK